MKKVTRKLALIESAINGSLDGIELDTTADVIEKTFVIETFKRLLVMVNEAQTEVKNLNIPAVSGSVCNHKWGASYGEIYRHQMCELCGEERG